MACAADDRFMFVEYSGPVAPTKGEKKRRGGPSEVRAHITKEFHRRLRVKRQDALKGDDAKHPNSHRPPPQDDETIDDETIDDEEQHAMRRHRAPTSPSARLRPAASSEDTKTPPQSMVPCQLKTVLGEGRMDPFDVLPARRMPLFIHQVLDHALVHTWPNTVPVRSESLMMNPVRSAWLKCAMQWPLAFHAFIYATTLHLLCAHNGRELTDSAPLLRLFHKVETIKLVNEQLHNLSGLPSDALIMAVTILAIHGKRDETVYPELHPRSPLATAQQLHVYGNMVNDEEHVQAIILLIMQKGGLEAIDLYGMADTMALCDLYFATKYARKPAFPLRRPPQSLVVSGKHLLDPIAINLDSRLGGGFRYLRSTASGRDLLELLEAMCEVVTALDHYARGGPTAPDLFDLIEARHTSQHRFLSQMPEQLDLSDADSRVLHASRLATLIFSDMVIFPLPPTQGVKSRLAPVLQEALETCDLLCCWDLHSQLLLWVLTLGAIAATFTDTRSWYLDQLMYHLSALQIQEWPALEEICFRFLWWEPVCGEPGRLLWEDMFPPWPRASVKDLDDR